MAKGGAVAVESGPKGDEGQVKADDVSVEKQEEGPKVPGGDDLGQATHSSDSSSPDGDNDVVAPEEGVDAKEDSKGSASEGESGAVKKAGSTRRGSRRMYDIQSVHLGLTRSMSAFSSQVFVLGGSIREARATMESRHDDFVYTILHHHFNSHPEYILDTPGPSRSTSPTNETPTAEGKDAPLLSSEARPSLYSSMGNVFGFHFGGGNITPMVELFVVQAASKLRMNHQRSKTASLDPPSPPRNWLLSIYEESESKGEGEGGPIESATPPEVETVKTSDEEAKEGGGIPLAIHDPVEDGVIMTGPLKVTNASDSEGSVQEGRGHGQDSEASPHHFVDFFQVMNHHFGGVVTAPHVVSRAAIGEEKVTPDKAERPEGASIPPVAPALLNVEEGTTALGLGDAPDEDDVSAEFSNSTTMRSSGEASGGKGPGGFTVQSLNMSLSSAGSLQNSMSAEMNGILFDVIRHHFVSPSASTCSSPVHGADIKTAPLTASLALSQPSARGGPGDDADEVVLESSDPAPAMDARSSHDEPMSACVSEGDGERKEVEGGVGDEFQMVAQGPLAGNEPIREGFVCIPLGTEVSPDTFIDDTVKRVGRIYGVTAAVDKAEQAILEESMRHKESFAEVFRQLAVNKDLLTDATRRHVYLRGDPGPMNLSTTSIGASDDPWCGIADFRLSTERSPERVGQREGSPALGDNGDGLSGAGGDAVGRARPTKGLVEAMRNRVFDFMDRAELMKVMLRDVVSKDDRESEAPVEDTPEEHKPIAIKNRRILTIQPPLPYNVAKPRVLKRGPSPRTIAIKRVLEEKKAGVVTDDDGTDPDELKAELDRIESRANSSTPRPPEEASSHGSVNILPAVNAQSRAESRASTVVSGGSRKRAKTMDLPGNAELLRVEAMNSVRVALRNRMQRHKPPPAQSPVPVHQQMSAVTSRVASSQASDSYYYDSELSMEG